MAERIFADIYPTIVRVAEFKNRAGLGSNQGPFAA